MTIQDFILWASPVLVPLVGGLVGTGLETLGTKLKIASLVGIGQRVEALFADVPKMIRGSRATAMLKTVRLPPPPNDDDLPPTPRTGAGAAPLGMLLLAGALSLSQTSCGGSIPPPKPGCDDDSAAQIAALCFSRVQTECVNRGIPEEECGIIAACDEEAANRKKECLQ